MRSPGFNATTRALGRGVRALVMAGLLAACSSDADQGPSTDTRAAGAGASSGSSNGTAGAGSDVSSQAVGSTAAGTGGSDGSGAGAVVGSGGTGGGPGDLEVVCNPIGEGVSTVTVNGTSRMFQVQLPANTSSQVAILFLWHGWMQAPSDFASTIVYDVPSGQWRPFDPNAFPMPLMIVSPYDTKMIPPWGLDWDIATGAVDFPFFEGMLQCIQEQFDVDTTRIYSFGFSAGAVFTNLLSARYPDLFAATISESGAWFNDTTQTSEVLVPIVQWKWPDFVAADAGNVLLSHGGPNDFATIISLENTNQKALPFLYDHGRTVMECTHTFGHTLDPDLTQGMYYQYMWAHQLGGPPLSGMLPGFPTQGNPVGATACTFHPAP